MSFGLIGSVAGFNDSCPPKRRFSRRRVYPFRMTMCGLGMTSLSAQAGSADGRYQLRHRYYLIDVVEIRPLDGFTGKERDVAETGLDYFGARYYDSWSARWLSVDPLAEKYPGWSPYSYGADNPIKFIDADGRWIYIANLKAGSGILLNVPYGLNNKGFLNPRSPEFGKYDISYMELPENHIQVRNILNGFYGEYKEGAPRVASFLKETSLPVALFSTDVRSEFTGWTLREDAQVGGALVGMLLNSRYLDDATQLRKIFFHELVHSMSPSNQEFQAWAADYAMGYEDEKGILSLDRQYWQKGMDPAKWGKFFDKEGSLIKETQNEFWKAYRNYGNGIIGK